MQMPINTGFSDQLRQQLVDVMPDLNRTHGIPPTCYADNALLPIRVVLHPILQLGAAGRCRLSRWPNTFRSMLWHCPACPTVHQGSFSIQPASRAVVAPTKLKRVGHWPTEPVYKIPTACFLPLKWGRLIEHQQTGFSWRKNSTNPNSHRPLLN